MLDVYKQQIINQDISKQQKKPNHNPLKKMTLSEWSKF